MKDLILIHNTNRPNRIKIMNIMEVLIKLIHRTTYKEKIVIMINMDTKDLIVKMIIKEIQYTKLIIIVMLLHKLIIRQIQIVNSNKDIVMS
jgi:hypothetical protein